MALSFLARRGNGLASSLTRRRLATSSVFKPTDTFTRRHIGPSKAEKSEMLAALGCSDMEDLVKKTIPALIRTKSGLALNAPQGEAETLEQLREIASKNKVMRSNIGMGYHDNITPGVIMRNLVENPGWYTSYTPYQPEVSQGRLESLLNFQTMVADLTSMEISNASLLDEATAAAEAFSLCHGAARGKRSKFFVAHDVHPQTRGLIETRAKPLGVEVVVGDPATLDTSRGDFSGVLVQYPNTYGQLPDSTALASRLKESKTMLVAATDLLACTVLKPPGEWGADVAVGSAQRFGVPLFYGGPHAGFMAVAEQHVRKMAGRVIGVSQDSQGSPALRLAMQTREQHIRRDKATSNICTAQALLANVAAMYGVYHGPHGLKDIANRVHGLAKVFAEGLRATDASLEVSDNFFDTVRIDGVDAAAVQASAVARGHNIRVAGPSTVTVALDETTTREDVGQLLGAFGNEGADLDALAASAGAKSFMPEDQIRSSEFMTHPVFNSHHSETQMLRYLRQLEGRDLSLNHSMIALGSCTMKLNASSEMVPVSWPEFAKMHPFAPDDQALGYRELIDTLSADLCEITDFAAISNQPNSGANGEYAGLLCIQEYHEARGEGHRDVCLIPISAHGTNPASAAMCGMKVVVVKSDDQGNVDIEDLKAKAEKHSDRLSSLMITYPSTYGVFEEGVKEITDVIHSHGGQVYMDGANMNAQVGFCSPGGIGADVCHLNLHKTFCIPHGGGGPGVGSIGVKEHLAPFLPGNVVKPTGGEGSSVVSKEGGAVAAAPFGSAGILPITWMYIRMMGTDLAEATSVAILNANYMAKKLDGHFDILYRGTNGFCAHEFIIDTRGFKAASGIVEEDIAKRLIDYGFHAPTMSWPVPGTLMVEPTESEDRRELDRFCEAMIAIRGEIRDIEEGRADKVNNVMKNAPHTMGMLAAEEWAHPYSREAAVFPTADTRRAKFWPHVGRVDNVYGDRNLVCSCPPMEEYMEEIA